MNLADRDMSEGIASMAGLARILGLSRARVLQLSGTDDFPQAIPLQGSPEAYSARVWPVAEVLAWRAARERKPAFFREREDGT